MGYGIVGLTVGTFIVTAGVAGGSVVFESATGKLTQALSESMQSRRSVCLFIPFSVQINAWLG